MRPWKHFGARLSERLWPTAPTGRRSASAGNSSSISKPITTGAGSTALWGTNHLWNSKQQTTKIERTDSTKCVHKKGGREVLTILIIAQLSSSPFYSPYQRMRRE